MAAAAEGDLSQSLMFEPVSACLALRKRVSRSGPCGSCFACSLRRSAVPVTTGSGAADDLFSRHPTSPRVGRWKPVCREARPAAHRRRPTPVEETIKPRRCGVKADWRGLTIAMVCQRQFARRIQPIFQKPVGKRTPESLSGDLRCRAGRLARRGSGLKIPRSNRGFARFPGVEFLKKRLRRMAGAGWRLKERQSRHISVAD